MRIDDVFFFVLLICDGTSTSSVYSMAFAFAFAPIGTRKDSFGTFAFVFAAMEAPQYACMLFHFFKSQPHSHVTHHVQLSLKGEELSQDYLFVVYVACDMRTCDGP